MDEHGKSCFCMPCSLRFIFSMFQLQTSPNIWSMCTCKRYIFCANRSHPYQLVLGKKREGCIRYTEHVKLWCHKKMSCWRGLVPSGCQNTGFFFLQIFEELKNLQYSLSNKDRAYNDFPDEGGTATCNFW